MRGTWARWLALGVAVLGCDAVSDAFYLDNGQNFDVRLRAYAQLGIMAEDAAQQGCAPFKDPITGKILKGGNPAVCPPQYSLGDLGQEPRTQAHIYGLKGAAYEVQLAGAVSTRNAEASTDSAGAQDGSPPIQQILPRVNEKVKLILALALGILALGFVLLYRAPVKETNERGRH